MIMTAAGDQNNLYGVLCLPEGHAGSETAARSVESQVAEWEGSLSLPTSSSEVRVVASVPDGWFRDHHGAERRERMVSAARRGRFTVVDVVPTSATVAAAWASASAVMEGLELVVLLLGHREVETSVWRWEGTGLHPVERLWHEVLGGMDLLARIQRLLNNRGVRTERDQLAHLLDAGTQRLEVARLAARRNPAFQATPVIGESGRPEEQWLSARELDREIDAVAADLIRAVAVGAEVTSPVVLLDDGRMHSMILARVRERLKDRIEILPLQAAQQGAVLVSSQAVRVEVPRVDELGIVVHRVVAGQLVQEVVWVREVGTAAAALTRAGKPLVLQGHATAQLVFAGAGEAAGEIPQRLQVSCGYQVSAWPGWTGVTVVFRPVHGGEPVLVEARSKVRRTA